MTLQLFASKPQVTGGQHNTSFSCEPTEITEANAEAFFRHDHTTIQFEGCYGKGDNFVHATAIPFDIDNSHSDNPDDWVQPDDIANRLKEMGINFVIVASRNHLLQKDGKAPRPKFHVYLILSEPFTDSDTFVLLCEWCIRTFNADPKVKSKAQKLFGYGDNPHAFVNSWNEGQCVDIVLNEDDIAPVTPSTPEVKEDTVVDPLDNPNKISSTDFNAFVESGEWQDHLTDLEECGWTFIVKDDRILFQTPEGDHSPGQQDGNIKGGVVYIFSKAPSPFKTDKGYSIPQFFAGVLFGNTGKEGLKKFAERYLRAVPMEIGIAGLDEIVGNIKPIDWKRYYTTLRNGNVKPPGERTYMLRTIDRILKTTTKSTTPLVNYHEEVFYFTGTHYELIDELKLKIFLIECAIKCGVPVDIAVYQDFAEKLVKQFMINSARHNSGVSVPDTTYINLQNGILFFEKGVPRFEKHSPTLFIRYVLKFDFNPEAIAPLWQQHLDRSLPNPEKQLYLAECLALPFYQGRIEKAPLFVGDQDTGKSTTLNVGKAIYGAKNIIAESLSSLTQSGIHGDFARARLEGKLVNIASDISKKIHDDGVAKILISREKIAARHPFGEGFDIEGNYARLIFAMNLTDLPPQFFTDAALTKRAAIILFDQQVDKQKKDTDFADKIIANELPGVLNWIIAGLDRLLATGRLDPPPCCIEAMESIRKEIDPISAWVEEVKIPSYWTAKLPLNDAHKMFSEFCNENKYQCMGTRTFTQRLRSLGCKIERQNHHSPYYIYFPDYVPSSEDGILGDDDGQDVPYSGNDGYDVPHVPSYASADDHLADKFSRERSEKARLQRERRRQK